jgi:dihydrodipicolinate synthase/N-acetylneuraminate lyase
MTLASEHKQICDAFEEYKLQYAELTGDKGKKVAAGRARTQLMTIKKLAHSLRGSISEYKTKMK